MKTIEQRANDLLMTITGLKRDDKLRYIILAMKDQDKITRHACAETLTTDKEYSFYFDNGSGDTGMAIMKKDAHMLIMNTIKKEDR